MMTLRIVLPTGLFLETECSKLLAEGPHGSFCLLPRHIDYVSPIVPGIVAYTLADGEERFIAVDEGLLVKRDTELLLSTRRAVARETLEELKETVEDVFRQPDEHERKARSAAAKLEVTFVRRFLELSE